MQEPKRLYKSTRDRMILGVAGGLAEYFEVDPVLVRLVLVLLAFASAGTMVLIYIVAAIIMPSDTQLTGNPPPLSQRVEEMGHQVSEAGQRAGHAVRDLAGQGDSAEVRERRRRVAGIVLIAVGGILLAANFGWWWFSWSTWWPIVLIAAGALIIFGRGRRQGR